MITHTGFMTERNFIELVEHFDNFKYKPDNSGNFRYVILNGGFYMSKMSDESVRVYKGIIDDGVLNFSKLLSESESAAIFKEFYYWQLRSV